LSNVFPILAALHERQYLQVENRYNQSLPTCECHFFEFPGTGLPRSPGTPC
jgi:hypothetical protein